jgi:tRNA threonylcarbamoyladenosine biosynthesis protein TsaE
MRHVIFTAGAERRKYEVPTVEDWAQVAGNVAARLRPGDVVALSGPLGAGKTTFVQALAKRLGVQRVPQSPTFALMRTYRLSRAKNGIRRLIHVDAYRIEKESELMVLDLDEELADGQSILVIEWAEKAKKWLQRRDSLNLSIQAY